MNATVENLRRELGKKFPKARLGVRESADSTVPTGLFEQGSYPPGAISELVFSASFASHLVVAGLIGGAAGEADFPELALIDGTDTFDPQSFGKEACSRVLWVRCGGVLEMIRATALLVQDGNLPLILFDAVGLKPGETRALPASAWWRLKQDLEKTRTRLLVFSSFPLSPCPVLRWSVETRVALADFSLPRHLLLERIQPHIERQRRAN